MKVPNITQNIAHWVLGDHDIPVVISKQIPFCFIDTLAVGIGASKLPFVNQFQDFIAEYYPGNDASLWNSGKKANILGAIFYNATLSHALDYDDTCWAGFTHPSAIFIPVVMALAEKYNLEYSKIEEAIALSYEVMGRIGICDKDFHKKGWLTSASFGSTATAILTGKLLGFTKEELTHAVGLSLTGCGAIRGNNGTMGKWVTMGMPACHGVKAAMLVKHGFTASDEGLEKREGFFHATCSNPDYTVFDNLSEFSIWKDYSPAFKLYPSCSSTHASMDAAHEIITQEKIDIADIQKIESQLTTSSAKFINSRQPENSKDAAFSIPYCIAALLVKDSFGIRELYPGYWDNRQISSLMGKISYSAVTEFEVGTEEEYPEGANVIVTTKDNTIQKFIGFAKGAGHNGFTGEEFNQKFDSCLDYAGLSNIKKKLWKNLNTLESRSSLASTIQYIR